MRGEWWDGNRNTSEIEVIAKSSMAQSIGPNASCEKRSSSTTFRKQSFERTCHRARKSLAEMRSPAITTALTDKENIERKRKGTD